MILSSTIFLAILLSAIAQQEPAAIVVRPPAASTAIATQQVKFTCVAYGNPTPSVQWSTLSGNDLTATAANGSDWVTITETEVTTSGVVMLVSVLELCNVDARSADTYTCTASNGVTGAGIAPSTASFTLTVTQPKTAPPAIVLRPPENNQVSEGQSVRITCAAYGSPVPDIYWSKPGCLKMSNDTNNVYVYSDIVTMYNVTMRWSTLQICSAGADDSTQYSCWADNGVTGSWGLGDPVFNFNIRVALRDTPPPTEPSARTEAISDASGVAVPFIVLMALLIVAVIVLLIVVIILGFYAMKKKGAPNKTNYAVTMGALNPASEGYEVSTPDDQELISDDIKHDLTLDAEDVGTDTQ